LSEFALCTTQFDGNPQDFKAADRPCPLAETDDIDEILRAAHVLFGSDDARLRCGQRVVSLDNPATHVA